MLDAIKSIIGTVLTMNLDAGVDRLRLYYGADNRGMLTDGIEHRIEEVFRETRGSIFCFQEVIDIDTRSIKAALKSDDNRIQSDVEFQNRRKFEVGLFWDSNRWKDLGGKDELYGRFVPRLGTTNTPITSFNLVCRKLESMQCKGFRLIAASYHGAHNGKYTIDKEKRTTKMLEKMAAYVKEHSIPVLVGGDFNFGKQHLENLKKNPAYTFLADVDIQVHILFPNENTTGTQCIDGFILITPRLKRRRHRIEANTDLKLHGFYKKETPITKVEVLLMDHQPVSMEYNIIPDPELVYEEELVDLRTLLNRQKVALKSEESLRKAMEQDFNARILALENFQNANAGTEAGPRRRDEKPRAKKPRKKNPPASEARNNPIRPNSNPPINYTDEGMLAMRNAVEEECNKFRLEFPETEFTNEAMKWRAERISDEIDGLMEENYYRDDILIRSFLRAKQEFMNYMAPALAGAAHTPTAVKDLSGSPGDVADTEDNPSKKRKIDSPGPSQENVQNNDTRTDIAAVKRIVTATMMPKLREALEKYCKDNGKVFSESEFNAEASRWTAEESSWPHANAGAGRTVTNYFPTSTPRPHYSFKKMKEEFIKSLSLLAPPGSVPVAAAGFTSAAADPDGDPDPSDDSDDDGADDDAGDGDGNANGDNAPVGGTRDDFLQFLNLLFQNPDSAEIFIYSNGTTRENCTVQSRIDLEAAVRQKYAATGREFPEAAFNSEIQNWIAERRFWIPANDPLGRKKSKVSCYRFNDGVPKGKCPSDVKDWLMTFLP